jgi:hypothetical protein
MKINTKSALFLFLLLTSVTTLVAQKKLKGNKIVITENRDIFEFTKIELRDNIDVILTQGNDQSVVVETDENLQFAVITEIKNGTLEVYLFKKIIKKKALNIYISIDESIDEITTKGKVDVSGEGVFNFNSLTINTEGNSKIVMDIKSEKFMLNNNESANVNLTVNTENATINANKTGRSKISLTSNTTELFTLGNSNTQLLGNCKDIFITSENKSNVRAGKFECDDAIVNASDASDVYVNSRNTITVSAINSAEVYIYGNPEITIEKFTDKAILRKK